MFRTLTLALFIVAALPAQAQQSNNPFPTPIEATQGVIPVHFVEFAAIPDVGTEPARMMMMADEPGTRRLFVAAMQGPIFSVSYDGKTVTEYVNVNAPQWNNPVQASFSERGIQSIAFHPQFNQRGARGYGKFYTYHDTTNMTPPADFTHPATAHTHDTVLLEWTAKNPGAAAYDGDAPREIFRAAQPFPNHNGGEIAFNDLAAANSPEYGLLYIGLADGGSGGDPNNVSQNLQSAFGKILRIDPLGTNSKNAKYGIPKDNPFVGKPDVLGEIYALGVRNPQRFSWDSKDRKMYVADIGQNIVEEISPVTAGANLGWNIWEGSYKYGARAVDTTTPRADAAMTWPIAEFDHTDPLLNRPAITGVYVYRQNEIKQLQNMMLFGDNPSGEIFYLDADKLPAGGQDQIRRVMFDDKGTNKTLLQLIREKNAAQGKPAAPRTDLRFGRGNGGKIYIMNKRDGLIRLLVP